MKNYQDVIKFNSEVLGIKPRHPNLLSKEEFTFSMLALAEERNEFVLAHKNEDLIGCIDAVLDGIYFSIGILYKLGLTAQQMEQAMTIIHNANMRKKVGINNTRDTGAKDAVKPTNWQGPEYLLACLILGQEDCL